MKRQSPLRSVIVVGRRFGLLLGAVHVANHSLELFANLQPSLAAVRGVAMWSVLFLVCGAASSSAVGRTRSVRLGTAASVLTAVYGATILVAYAVAVSVLRGDPLPIQTVVSTGGLHIGGSVLVGTTVGLASGAAAMALAGASRVTALLAVVAQALLLVAGLSAIAYATSLERSARPPFIMFGLPSVALALAAVAPSVWALRFRHRPIAGVDPSRSDE